MGATHALTVGDRGRIVLPADVRSDLNWQQGTKLILARTETGVILMSVEQTRAVIKAELAGSSLADELITERHAEAAAEADR